MGAGGTPARWARARSSTTARWSSNAPNEYTVDNVISGWGSLKQTGSGTLVLTGDNSYSGSTTIAAGTLQVGDGGTTGSLGTGDVSSTMAAPGLQPRRFDHRGQHHHRQRLMSQTDGNTGPHRQQQYSGTTTIAAGTLQVGAGGDTGSLGTGGVTSPTTVCWPSTAAASSLSPTTSQARARCSRSARAPRCSRATTATAAAPASLPARSQMGSARPWARRGHAGRRPAHDDRRMSSPTRSDSRPARQAPWPRPHGTTLCRGRQRACDRRARFGTSSAAGTIALDGPLTEPPHDAIHRRGNPERKPAFLVHLGRLVRDRRCRRPLDYQGDGRSTPCSAAARSRPECSFRSPPETSRAPSRAAAAGAIGRGQPRALRQQHLHRRHHHRRRHAAVGNGGTSGSLGTGNVTNNGTLVFNRSMRSSSPTPSAAPARSPRPAPAPRCSPAPTPTPAAPPSPPARCRSATAAPAAAWRRATSPTTPRWPSTAATRSRWPTPSPAPAA